MKNNYSHRNLRGCSFKGKDLAGADFSHADIRGADFTDAILEGANFIDAKAGLQKRWAIFLFIVSLLLSGLSGSISGLAGYIAAQGFNAFQLSNKIAAGAVITALVIFCLLTIRYGILAGLGVVAGAFAVTGILAVTNVAPIIVFGTAASIGIGSVAAAGAGAFAVAVASAETFSLAGAIIGSVAGVIAGILIVDGAKVFTAAFTFAGAVVLLSFYISWQAMKGNEKHTIVRNIAIAFAAFGGTSFRKANLTDANFTGATLKSTDFRNAIVARTRFYQTKMLDRVRPGSTYLQKAQVRQLLVTGRLGQNQKFDHQDLRGVNLQGANLENASLIDVDFYQANLSNVDLSRTVLVRTNFERADLRGACLTGSCIQDWIISRGTKLNGIVCDYVYLKWDNVKKDKRDQMPPRGKFKEGGFVTFIKYILDTVELYHEKDINPRLALTVLQKMSRDYDEPLNVVAIGKRGEKVFIQVKVSERIIQDQFKEDYYSRYDEDWKLWSSNSQQLPPAIDNLIEKKIVEITSEKTDDFVFFDITHVEGNYVSTYQGDITMTGDRTIHMGSGNYNEQIEGNYFQQEGSFGIGVNTGEVKAEKIAGTINEAQNEVLQMIESLRQQIEALDNQAVRTEALEYLEDLETEAQSSLPKQSRLKSSLMTLFNVVKDTSQVANAVTAVAERLGVRLFHLP